MLKFFNVLVYYENTDEEYAEPGDDKFEIIKNIIQEDLICIKNQTKGILKHFKIVAQ